MFGFGGVSFNPEADIPDLSGKVIVVTGGNNGLGYASVRALAKHNPAKIYLAARSQEKADTAIANIKKEVPNANVSPLILDLASFASVKEAAETFKSSNDRLDILLNNAGVMACPSGLTKEGYELQFGTNHLGHALLTKLLLPVLQTTAAKPDSDVRIVNVSSEGNRIARAAMSSLEEFKTDLASTNTWVRYGYSKAANIFFTHSLAEKYPDIKSIVIHPGSVSTNLIVGPQASYPLVSKFIGFMSPILLKTPDQGALNQLWATVSPQAKSGRYYVPVGKEGSYTSLVQDKKLQESLWEWTEKQFAAKGY